MKSTQKVYKIQFGEEPEHLNQENINVEIKEEIPINIVEMRKEFPFYDYNSSSTIEYLKEYFLTTFGQDFNYCKCVLSVYYKKGKNYQILSSDAKKKLSDFKQDKLYIIKTNTLCDCEFKEYDNYMNMEKFDIIKDLKSIEDEIEKLENSQINFKEIKKENALLKKTDEIQNVDDSKIEKFYDIVIGINSIKNINKEGWEVKFDEKGKKKYERNKNRDLITIGVLGNSNKGKSFLLSKISKIQLLSGTSINTEGLSIRYPELKKHKGRKLILLDSAGLETPVLISDNINKKNDNEDENEKNKEFKENTRDKIMTELFLQNLIIEVSDILFIVVGKLTYSEQLLINKIKMECKNKRKRVIFVIHNLQEFRTKKQVEDYLKNTLLKCSTFNLKKRTWISTQKDEEKKKDINEMINNNINNNNQEDDDDELIGDEAIEESQFYDVHFTEIIKYGNNKLEVYHLILANEDSDAGKVYNQYTYNFIEHVYNLIAEPKKFEIFDEVKKNIKKLSGLILKDDIKDIPFTDNDKILEQKRIKLEYEKDLSLKKCFTDELGFSFFKTGDFEPKYNCFKPDERTVEIRVETPGNINCTVTHTIEGDKTIVIIKGEKKRDTSPENPDDVFLNFREFSEFELHIPLKVKEFKINSQNPKEGYPKFQQGCLLIQYELAEEALIKEIKQEGL